MQYIFENKGKWLNEFEYSDLNDGNMIDVLDDRGNIKYVPLSIYEKYRALFQSRLSKAVSNKNREITKNKQSKRLENINKELNRLKEEERHSIGLNAKILDDEINNLEAKRDKICLNLWGKTFNQLKNKKRKS